MAGRGRELAGDAVVPEADPSRNHAEAGDGPAPEVPSDERPVLGPERSGQEQQKGDESVEGLFHHCLAGDTRTVGNIGSPECETRKTVTPAPAQLSQGNHRSDRHLGSELRSVHRALRIVRR